MDGTALLLCDGAYGTVNGKTAHGLVRGTSRYRIVGVVDPPTAGRDAGEVLDGVSRGIPIYRTLEEALERLPERPDFAVVGIATSGGRFTPELKQSVRLAVERRLSVVNGLHEFLRDDAELSAQSRRTGAKLIDVRWVPPRSELHFWSGKILSLAIPRIAVLGTDCALGKRTTTRLAVERCRAAGIRAEWISTGQTGWMQGAPFGIVLDSIPNDFVSGELEHAILSCARALNPEVILLEGQSSLRNPSGPCGAEFILSGGARAVILQHAPGREYFDGWEKERLPIPPVAEEIELIRMLGAEVVALALNGEGLNREELDRERSRLERELSIPAVLPLEEGVDRLVPVIREVAKGRVSR
jgi:uncharacterized NAD-dependent epimerase/dehydratase family protein